MQKVHEQMGNPVERERERESFECGIKRQLFRTSTGWARHPESPLQKSVEIDTTILYKVLICPNCLSSQYPINTALPGPSSSLKQTNFASNLLSFTACVSYAFFRRC